MVFEKGKNKKQYAECNTNSPILHEGLLQALALLYIAVIGPSLFLLLCLCELLLSMPHLYILLLEILFLFSIELFWRVLQKEFNVHNHIQATKSLAVYCQHLVCLLVELSNRIQYPPTTAQFSHQITMIMSYRHWSIRIGAATDGPSFHLLMLPVFPDTQYGNSCLCLLPFSLPHPMVAWLLLIQS